MTAPPPPEQPRFPWRVPLLCVVLIVVGWFAWDVWNWLDLDPIAFRPLHAGGKVLAVVAFLGLLIWFFIVPNVPRWAHITVGVVLASAVIFLAASIDSYDVTGDLGGILHFRWERSAEADLNEYLKGLDDDGLPPVNVMADLLTDFPCYRGLNRDGAAPPSTVYDLDWTASEPRLLWKHPCGGGFSGFAVAGNVAITIELREVVEKRNNKQRAVRKEVAVCYGRDTGKQRWATPFAKEYIDLTGSGPRATPTIHDGSVFVFGANDGTLARLDAATGKKIWSVDALEDCKAERVTWGMASSPLVLGDVVIVNVGIDKDNNAKRALAAYRINNGERVWDTGDQPAGYSSPMRAKLAGREQILLFDAGGLAGYDIESHKELWRHEWKTFMDMNIIQPVVVDHDKVLISSEPGNGAALVQIKKTEDGFTTEEVWQNRNLVAKYANPVLLNQWVFGLSNGTMVCLDAATGKRQWRGKYYGHGQLLALNGSVLVLSERGEVALVSADAREFRELGRFQALKGRTWNTPALAGRQLFVRNDKEMACYELPALEK
jgi:outer membrane protein assembly factor BamB